MDDRPGGSRARYDRRGKSNRTRRPLEPGKCADFFSINLHTVDYAGALHDPVAATVFCAPQKARYTVINGRVVVENGEVATVDMGPVIEEHNRWSLILADRG